MPATHDSLLAKQTEATAQHIAAPAADPVEQALPEPFPAIPVRNESPALGVDRCVALSAANPVRMLLPQDPRRRNAMILAVDNDVYICSSLELAQAVQGLTTASDGFYLPKGIVVPITNKAAHWVAATTTASTSRVSVLVSKDDQ